MSPDEVYDQSIEMGQIREKPVQAMWSFPRRMPAQRAGVFVRLFEGVIKAGATCINVPDTVGYATPEEFYDLICGVKNNVAGMRRWICRCTATTIWGWRWPIPSRAVRAGATQVECTINGIGERAGNAALEEIVMVIDTRHDVFGVRTNIDTRQIYNASRLLSSITGVSVQPNKAVVGANAFAHEAGIHQHGVLANKATYEIMTPESIGLPENMIVLGKHSGKHAFAERLTTLGYTLDDATLADCFDKFKDLADRKKTVTDMDLRALVEQDIFEVPTSTSLTRLSSTAATR